MRKYQAGAVVVAGPPRAHFHTQANARAGAAFSERMQTASRRERPEPIYRDQEPLSSLSIYIVNTNIRTVRSYLLACHVT
eukprot:3499909-Pyramimonas_sp.AAC.1